MRQPNIKTQPYTVDELLKHTPVINVPILPTPTYTSNVYDSRPKVGMAVESMKRHMTDEGWQIFLGLQHTGYQLCGYDITSTHKDKSYFSLTDTNQILGIFNPSVVLMQDKREWDTPGRRDFREHKAVFHNVQALASRQDIFKLTILKDAHQRQIYHRQSAEEIGCNAWVIYYHPKIVQRLAPYVRPQHLIRTYHSIDPYIVPDYTSRRNGCILAGAISGAYPLRANIARNISSLPLVTHLMHPGYHMRGCQTPDFLKTLSTYKVAICTSSIYGYSLRKIVEATAAGCVVVTDLPSDDILPEVDENLIRVNPSIPIKDLGELLLTLYACYSPDRQMELARKCIAFYNYKATTRRLAEDIEKLRVYYNVLR